MDLGLLEKAVLAALLRGVDSFGGLRRLINVGEDELRRVVNKLVQLGLVRVERRGLIFKREVLKLTEKGFEEAEKAVKELESIARSVEEKLEGKGLRERVEEIGFLDDIAYILPLLTWLGFLDLALLSPLVFMVEDQDYDYGDMDYGDYGSDVEEV